MKNINKDMQEKENKTQKELLEIEFRYRVKSTSEYDSGLRNKTIVLGIFNTLEEAVEKGNEALKVLSKHFEVRANDSFEVKGLFGCPCRLVTNCCYPTSGIQYFAKITTLKFDDLSMTIHEMFEAVSENNKHE